MKTIVIMFCLALFVFFSVNVYAEDVQEKFQSRIYVYDNESHEYRIPHCRATYCCPEIENNCAVEYFSKNECNDDCSKTCRIYTVYCD